MQTRGAANILGVDLSAYQTITNAALLFAQSPNYIYLRAYGSSHTAPDTTFLDRVTLANSYGVPTGGYYFATPTTPITTSPAECEAQAEQFADVLEQAYGAGNYGDLIPVVDCESWDATTPQKPMYYGMYAAQIVEWIKHFKEYFFARTGRRLGFYSNRYFLEDSTQLAMTSAQISEFWDMPLWLAEYDEWYPQNVPDNAAPANLGGWTSYMLWQYSQDGAADTYGVTHGQNQIDLNRTTSVDLLKPPPPPTDINPVQIADNMLEVTFTKPIITDLLGLNLYIDGVWKKWISKTASSVQFDITNYTRNAEITVQIMTEDNYHDLGKSEIKTLTIFPTEAEATAFYNPPPKETTKMPKRTSGITATSLNNFIIDAGAVYVNYGELDERLLGATRGGNSFKVEVEMREMEIDGVRQAIMGSKRITNVAATITCNLIELTAENLALSLTGSELGQYTQEPAVTPTHDTIKRIREIGTMDYVKNIAIVGKVNNSTENFIGLVYNALSSGGLEIGMEDDNESAIELTFTAHIDPASIADDGTYEEAWEIRMPKATA